MKLTEGTYENLITDGLRQDMQETMEAGAVCKQEDIDSAEAPDMLTEFLSLSFAHHIRLLENAKGLPDLLSSNDPPYRHRPLAVGLPDRSRPQPGRLMSPAPR